MRDLRCRFGLHVAYVEDTPDTFRTTAADVLANAELWVDEVVDAAEKSKTLTTKMVFGGVRRYCLRCGITLDGDIPRVGDRRSHAA